MYLNITGIQRQVLISSCLYLGQISVGFFAAWTGAIVPKLRDLDQSPLHYKLTEAQISLVATFTYLGAIPGPYVSGWLSNIIGRKPCLMIGGGIAVIGSSILAAATTLAMIYIGRFLLGFAAGIIFVMGIVYIGEIASTNIRGIFLTTFGLFHTVGNILLFACGPFLSYSGTTVIALATYVIFTFGVMFIPESPMFYILKGNKTKVKEVLDDLGRSEDIEELLSVTKENLEINNMKDWSELFTLKSNRIALFIGLVINILQNCSGNMAVIFFSSSIFEMSGSTVSSHVSMIIIGFFQLSGSTLSSLLVERIGRKAVLLISTFVCSLSMFMLGLYFYLNALESSVISHLKWLPLVILIIFFISYDLGFGVVPNVIVGEMFTTNIRSRGSTLTITFSWLFGFAVSTAFGVMLETVGGHVSFWFFSCTCACAFLFTKFFIPETKGKSLLEIQDLLSNGIFCNLRQN